MNMPKFELNVSAEGGRRGVIRTAHGEVRTPFFMPDATMAAVRGIESDVVRRTGIEALVVNTYHLMLRPGSDLIARAGGIHRFMRWNAPILSDSGGYQVYSLIHRHPEMGEITEEGAVFRSPLDGSKRLLTPEASIDIQFDLGVDMMVCLDDPRPNDTPDDELSDAVLRTIRWARRCKDRYEDRIREMPETSRPLLFGVIQGGMRTKLRKRCAEALVDIGFDGYGFGARHVDMEGNFLEEIVRETASFIPETAIRFALGVGTPSDIVRAHALGWDLFDCVIPTREGRHGRAFVRKLDSGVDGRFYETENLSAERFREDTRPIDESCECSTCASGYSRAAIRHFLSIGDPLGSRLIALHNLRLYAELLERLRKAVVSFSA